MEYLLIVILQLLGVGFQVGPKLYHLDKQFTDDTLQEVWSVFWNSDRVTMFISAFILLLDLVTHLIIHVYAPEIREWRYNGLINYFTVSFSIALMLGYAGQRILYHYMGTAEKVLMERADKFEKLLK